MKRIEAIVIAAVSRDLGIGKQGHLPWSSKSELQHFQSITLGYPVIMGSKTYTTLPKLLCGREHIVVSRNPNRIAPGAYVTTSLDAAIQYANDLGYDKCFIIGGGEIYKEALSNCDKVDKLYLSFMEWEGDTDVSFPEFDHKWKRVGRIAYSTENIPWTAFEYNKK